MLSSSSGRCRVESSGAGKVMLVNDGVLLTPDKEKTSAMRSRVRRLRKHSTQVMRAAGGDSTSEVLPGGVTNATTTTSATDQTKGPTGGDTTTYCDTVEPARRNLTEVEEQLVASFAALRDEIAEMRGDRQNEGRDRRRDLHARGHAEDQESAFSQVPIEEKGGGRGGMKMLHGSS
ncbi:unnamed protein product [Vitrella brassicaformis CCMP3155]|uniref:Uncharacterized protein n=1 Tax=Vitrella brassicaformis (strain CCMP3155) TaxID=1169540 RepID=A0A0G4FU83_VITBC|nr:unnamed protein product [Vitrella brassicaformis CCMP3155]|eukprot:CEM18242.1 unnamed protein product [Vitrella brassicaformis CCMP3155]